MLHIASPSHFTSSSSLIGLMRLAINQFHQEKHQVILIGDLQEVQQCRAKGLPVIGSLSGVTDSSNTLCKKLLHYIRESQLSYSNTIVCWGWHALAVAKECSPEYCVLGVVDEVDQHVNMPNTCTVIPTNDVAANRAIELGFSSSCLVEQIVGVEPTSVVVDRREVFDLLQKPSSTFLVSVVGNLGSWNEIITMATRLRLAKMQTAFVVPRTYRDYALLMKSALQHGVFDMIQEAPPALRQVDLVHASDCAWAPSTAPYDSSSAVLDVLSAAWEETPLAVCSSHPIGTIPSIGSQIAWAKDNLEICGWMQDIKRGAPWVQTQCTNRVTTVRSIASPSRFIDGMKMRLFNRS